MADLAALQGVHTDPVLDESMPVFCMEFFVCRSRACVSDELCSGVFLRFSFLVNSMSLCKLCVSGRHGPALQAVRKGVSPYAGISEEPCASGL